MLRGTMMDMIMTAAGRCSAHASLGEIMGRPSNRVLGIALVAGGVVLWSTAGLFVRLLELDNATIQAWRSLFGALSLLIIILGQHGRRTPEAFRSIDRKS